MKKNRYVIIMVTRIVTKTEKMKLGLGFKVEDQI